MTTRCPRCNGAGERRTLRRIGPSTLAVAWETCPTCEGFGRVIEEDGCAVCHDTGLVCDDGLDLTTCPACLGATEVARA